MLQRLKRLFGRKSSRPTEIPRKVPASRHIPHSAISGGAREVVARLVAAGHQAFIVGGCIRDTLLGHPSKDFDVATSATPEEVKQLFRRARIVGRRFRIVHVHVGRELVEVTTFRASHAASPHATAPPHSSEQARRSQRGMLLRDNVFGSLEEDAERRDFTINAIYYDPQRDELLDFVGGLEDIASRTLRIIGDPATRFREDPVRMLRAARFIAKLDFALDPATAAPLAQLHALLREIPPARLFDEVLKLLMTGRALATYEALSRHRLFQHLFPDTAAAIHADARWDAFVRQALINTDLRIKNDQRVTPAFLFAALLWPAVAVAEARHSDAGPQESLAPLQSAADVLTRALRHIAIPRRFSAPAREIWELQPRLERRGGRRAWQLLEHPRFRAAYDFVLLREQSGEDLGGLGEWWTRFQAAGEDEREQMAAAVKGPAPPRRRRSRRRKPDSGPA
ncbi:MAG: polynucleotide adenylyltransferase PcnB [Gammaproteobacteria bacterium]|nr:polynucleotide adenylyltransferase PcnB [Gammaproteobacteria bacterium]